MTKNAPSYYEHVAGQPELRREPTDVIEFVDDTIEVTTLELEQLTPEQREAYDRAFK